MKTQLAVKRAIRMRVPEGKEIEHAAAMIALIGHRKNCKRWRMSKTSIRTLCQRPIRAAIFQKLSDCLAEYSVMIMDNADNEFSFVKVEVIEAWYRCGISELTDEERRTPNMEAMEVEFGYKGPWADMTDDEPATDNDA